jgi:NAD(P)-dependent dehydrogenase (short-subunit alcohol dehydrogenase family)
MKLDGKVALITGGTKGIGAATALLLAQGGADVAIVGRRADVAANRVKAGVETLGRRCVVLTADLARPEDAVRCVGEAAKGLGRIDALVHCAGGRAPGGLLEVSPEVWYRAFDVHVHAIYHLCRAAVPLMKKNEAGAIVLVSSAAGLRGCLGALAYGVVKGAIPQFARALARELAGDNIRVNCVAPGVIRTAFQDHLTPEQVRNNIENRIPLHHEGQPEDVAQVIAMLVTNDFVTGECVGVDGGMAMRIV